VSIVIDEELPNGALRGSVARAWLLGVHEGIEALVARHATVPGRVEHLMRGGFAVTVLGVRAFMPGRESGVRAEEAPGLLGREIQVRLLRMDERSLQPVVSRRELAAEEERAQREAFLGGLEPGGELTGRVTGIRPFGAFVQVAPGVDGLIPVSELGAGAVERAEDAVVVGDEVTVRIVEVDARRGRLTLSRRDVLQEASQQEVAGWAAGDVREGIVTRLADFGAFVELAPGVEGLCHVSELSWTERVQHPSEVLQEGQRVEVRLLSIEGRRIGLSLRQTAGDPWHTFAEAHPEGSVVTGTLTRIEGYGLFLEVAPGIEGLCHISDLAWTGRPQKPTDVAPFAVGQAVDAVVLRLDLGKRRISLGIKQLTRDPWDAAADLLQRTDPLDGTVTRIEEAAAWVEIAPGLEGRIHISELSMERVDSVRAVVRPGQSVQVVIRQADRERRRLDLSIREIEARQRAELPSEWKESDDAPSPLALALAARLGGSGAPESEGDAAALGEPSEGG
jgi:small subunit ribosomal protein S1